MTNPLMFTNLSLVLLSLSVAVLYGVVPTNVTPDIFSAIAEIHVVLTAVMYDISQFIQTVLPAASLKYNIYAIFFMTTLYIFPCSAV